MIQAAPETVDAGTDIMLQAEVSCAASHAPRGLVRIIDAQGETLAETPLVAKEMPGRTEAGEDAASDEPGTESPQSASAVTAEWALKAPASPGDYTWKALFVPAEAEGMAFGESSVDFSFTVRAHLISVSVWGVPVPASRGEPFKVCVGACCSAGCSLAALPLQIGDGQNILQNAILGTELLAQTRATYWAEIELQAPDNEQLNQWTVDCAIPESSLPHQTEPAALVFQTVAKPHYEITVEVTDSRDKLPLEGAYVMLGPYKCVTDKQGIAKLKVSGGAQRLFVSLRDYLAHEEAIEINGATTIKAELMFSPLL
jgi:hypothetical protein